MIVDVVSELHKSKCNRYVLGKSEIILSPITAVFEHFEVLQMSTQKLVGLRSEYNAHNWQERVKSFSVTLFCDI